MLRLNYVNLCNIFINYTFIMQNQDLILKKKAMLRLNYVKLFIIMNN